MSTFKNIPPEIARILDQSVRRIRNIVLFRGLFTVGTVIAIFLLVSWGMFAMIDDIAGWVRWTFWAVSVGAIVASVWISLLRPLLRRYEPWEIAAFIERNHPELEERLSSVVGLASAGDVDVSGRLVEELTHDAVRDAGTVSPKREISTRSMIPWLIAVAVAGSIIAGIAVVFPKFTRNALVFAALPSSEVDNVYASTISVQPEDAVVLEGLPFTVKTVVEGSSLNKAFVRTRIGGGSESVERMEKEPGETSGKASFTYTYPRVEKSFSYRVKCGGGLTRAYNVRVVPEPAFLDRAIEIFHPEYTGRAPDRYTNSTAVVGLPGSRVRVSFRPSSDDVEGAAILPGAQTVAAVRGDDGRLACEFELGKEVEGSWGLQVWDSNGFSNKLETASITLVKDAAPTIRLIQPEMHEMKLPAFGELPLDYEITEDFGLSETVLEMCPGAGAWETCETLEPRKTGGVKWSGDAMVRFAGKDFGNAGVVRFRVKTTDTLPASMGGPGVAYSPEITVQLVSQNTSLARQSLAAQIAEGKAELDEIRKKLESGKRNLEYARGNFKNENNEWHRNEARKNLDWAKSNVTAAEGLLSTFIENLMDSRLETGADIFRPVLNDKFTPTRQEIEDIYLQARGQQKAESCEKAAKSVQECIDALAVARKRYDALTKAAENLQKLEDFAEREKALSEMFKEDEIDAKEFAEREEELAKKFEEEFKDELNKNLDWQKKVAEEMKKKTEQLEKRQEELKEKADQAQTDEEREALAKEEKKLSNDIRDQANRLGDLARDIESKAGPVEDDENKTAEPVKDAQADEYQAAKEAKEAAEKISNGDMEGAKQDMQETADALRKAQQALDDAQAKMDAKNQELADNAQDYKDMQQALNEAVEAAKAAAAEQAAREAQEAANGEAQQGEQQDGEAQQGDQQQGEAQQGDPQQGDPQQGDPQQGEQQDGDAQQGDPQSGEKQQGGDQQQQQGQQQKGQQQQGDQQQQGPQQGQQQQQGDQQQQTAAQQAAQQKAQQAAGKMQQKANQQAQKNNLPMDQFQPQQGPAQKGPADPNAKPDPNAKSDGQHMPSPNDKNGKMMAPEADDPEDGGQDWFKMKSDSATGADADKLDDVPEEYRGLVKDYFDALNKGGKK